MSEHSEIPAARIQELTREHIAIVHYDSTWPARYTAIEGRLERT